MWHQNWGQMIWGVPTPVPAVGFWGALLLGLLLGIVGASLLKSARRTALVTLAVALLVPISAFALPFTFTNGTVADATQVNADFAALVPVSASTTFSMPPPPSPGYPLVPPASPISLFPPSFSFVAPRALTCTVTVQLLSVFPSSPTGEATVLPAMMAGSSPSTSGLPVTMTASAAPPGAPSGTAQFQGNTTGMFSVASGATVTFGLSLVAITGGFVMMPVTEAVVIYNCQ